MVSFSKVAVVAVFGAAALLQADALAVKEAADPRDALKVQLPKVPQINKKYVGKDGLPELPSVDQMMSDATSTLSAMNSKAADLQAKMTEVQKQNAARLAKQKSIYDNQLKKQEKENQHLIGENKKLAHDIVQVKGSNEKMLAHTKQLQHDIETRRAELKDLRGLVGSTDGFVQEVLAETADKNSPELAVLVNGGKFEKVKEETKVEKKEQKKAEKKDEEDKEHKQEKKEEKEDEEDKEDKEDNEESKEEDGEDEDEDEKDEKVEKSEKAEKKEKAEKTQKAEKKKKAKKQEKAEKSEKDEKAKTDKAEADKKKDEDEDEDGDDETSFVQVSAAPATDSSESILTVLTKGLKDLKSQGKASEKELKKLFKSSFKTGEERHAALLSQQQVLHKTLDEMTYYGTKLHIAEKHLEETKAKLDSAIHKTGLVLKKLSQVALSPSEQALKNLENMRKATSAKKK